MICQRLLDFLSMVDSITGDMMFFVVDDFATSLPLAVVLAGYL
jgi:hypothetical protein